MKKRLIVSTLLVSLVLLSVVAQVSAITGRLGNSRMVLRLGTGEEARRSLLIQNVNDVPLTIELVASGDLAANVVFEENSFTLQPGEETNANFTIKTNEPGTTETKINVMFKPPQGSGVGLSANVVVIAGGDTVGNGNEDPTDGNQNNSGPTPSPYTNPPADGKPTGTSFKFTPITILAISTAALVVIFLILLVYLRKLNQKKRSGRPRD